ncbi:MAG TPA: hypothetical protein VN903_11015, partial [Polyangia bacterium]|nr:hypothetical protein [Polyangia bacterium]
SYLVTVKHPGGVMLPYEYKMLPRGMSAKVTQRPKIEGHSHIDVEQSLAALAAAGHVEVKEIDG